MTQSPPLTLPPHSAWIQDARPELGCLSGIEIAVRAEELSGQFSDSVLSEILSDDRTGKGKLAPRSPGHANLERRGQTLRMVRYSRAEPLQLSLAELAALSNQADDLGQARKELYDSVIDSRGGHQSESGQLTVIDGLAILRDDTWLAAADLHVPEAERQWVQVRTGTGGPEWLSEQLNELLNQQLAAAQMVSHAMTLTGELLALRRAIARARLPRLDQRSAGQVRQVLGAP